MDLPDLLSQDDLDLLARVREGDTDLLRDAIGLNRLKDRGLIRICKVQQVDSGETLGAPFPFPTVEGYAALGLKVKRVPVWAPQ